VDDSVVLRLMLAAGLFVAAGGGATAVVLRVIAGRSRLPVRPAGRPWSGPFVLLAFLVAILLPAILAGVAQTVLKSSGFFQTLYGPGFPMDVPDKAAPAEKPNNPAPVGKPENPTPAEKAAGTIRVLWANVITFPIVLAVILWLPRWLKVANPFATRGWPAAVVAGYLTWLIITPAVYCVFVLASLGHMKMTGRAPEKHPLTALGDLAGPREWALFVAQTIVIAPIIEEWLFRGVLLPWLARRRTDNPGSPFAVPPARRPILVLIAAVAAAVTFTLGTDWLARPAETRQTLSDPQAAVASYAIPAGFFLLFIPLDYAAPRFQRLRRHLRIGSRQQVRAILASAALFAAFHAHVWPSPIPLALLAVGLGYLYLRTRSLFGPILVHALFNAVSAVYLLLGGPA
jgi:membrane protease YdiL (CAAX protease family)